MSAFLWGTATSGHQIEGQNDASDWWEFERKFTPSGAACDFRNRFEGDLDIARSLGTNSFRFSLEWARLEPRPGERDARAAAYYERLIEACRERGLEPMATLVHFTLPRWVAERGGWLVAETLEAFERHVAWVAERFRGVKLWVTVNEPNVQARAGYVSGVFAPGCRLRPDLAGRCERALVRAHEVAHRVLHEKLGEVRVGVSPHQIAWRPSRWDVLGIARREARAFNWAYLEAVRPETLDFVGVNYYMTLWETVPSLLRFGGFLPRPAGPGTSDMGWPIDPSGFERVLLDLHARLGRPIIVTENGIADANDVLRPGYLESHLAALDRATRAGVKVDGYYHWSLLDNFEWHEGYGPRFGLVAVDYATQERRLRPSAQLYKRAIEARSAQGVTS